MRPEGSQPGCPRMMDWKKVPSFKLLQAAPRATYSDERKNGFVNRKTLCPYKMGVAVKGQCWWAPQVQHAKWPGSSRIWQMPKQSDSFGRVPVDNPTITSSPPRHGKKRERERKPLVFNIECSLLVPWRPGNSRWPCASGFELRLNSLCPPLLPQMWNDFLRI